MVGGATWSRIAKAQKAAMMAITFTQVSSFYTDTTTLNRNLEIREEMTDEGRTEKEIEAALLKPLTPIMACEHFWKHSNVKEISSIRKILFIESTIKQMEETAFYVVDLERPPTSSVEELMRLVPSRGRDYQKFILTLGSITHDLGKPGVTSCHALRRMMGLDKRV